MVHSSDEIDAGIDQLLRFMDPDAAAIENGNVLECLVWGGYWVAASDGQVDRVEVDSLQESTNPQLASAAAMAIKQSKEPLVFIQQRFHESAKQCRQLPPHQRHAMIQRMIAVAKANMSVASEEMVTLREICKALDVNPAFPEKILWQYEDFVFANYGTGT